MHGAGDTDPSKEPGIIYRLLYDKCLSINILFISVKSYVFTCVVVGILPLPFPLESILPLPFPLESIFHLLLD
jgi:hypothetical protein